MTYRSILKAWLLHLFDPGPEPKLGPQAQALKDLSKLVPSHWLDMLEPHIADEVHKPVGDGVTTQEEYASLCELEGILGTRAQDFGGLHDLGDERYAALAYFFAGAQRQIKGARQQYEQLLFDGKPMVMSPLTEPKRR
jgi:hypothetical protein